MIQVCCTCLISSVCSTLLTWRHLHSLATPGEDRRENSHSQEGVPWIHLLGQEDKRELFCWVYQWLNPNTAYLWQSTRMSLVQHPGSLVFEESPYIISVSSCPSLALHAQCHYWTRRAVLCFTVGRMHKHWYWFRYGEYLEILFHRAHWPSLGSGKKLTFVLACSKEAPAHVCVSYREERLIRKQQLLSAVTIQVSF